MPLQKVYLECLYNHVVLPAQIQTGVDEDHYNVGHHLGTFLEGAHNLLRTTADAVVWDTLDASLNTTRNTHMKEGEKDWLLTVFRKLGSEEETCPLWIALHVQGQNAGLLLHRDSNHIVFEAFQTAAPTSTVLEAPHALTWDFPDRAVALPLHVFNCQSFSENLANFLEQATRESFARFAARVKKVGRDIVETRGSASPALITEMLMSLLEGLGHSVDVPRTRKKVRDEVVLDRSDLPWRRSPYWLVLRLLIRRNLASLLNPGEDAVYFKFIMAAALAKVLEACIGVLHPEKVLTLLAKLSRRLAKLESERQHAKGRVRACYDELFSRSSEFFRQITKDAKDRTGTAWEGYKKSIVRRIPRLPRYVDDSDLHLQLNSSGEILQRLLMQTNRAAPVNTSLQLPFIPEGTVAQVGALAAMYTSVHDLETQPGMQSALPLDMKAENKCTILAKEIATYLRAAVKLYQDDYLLMSQCLLNVFEQWVAMDQVATKACKLLLDYRPAFVPDALDVLCLPSRADMARLQHIQQYIANRIERCASTAETIFSDPSLLGAFPTRFVKDNLSSFTALSARAEGESDRSRLKTQAKLNFLMRQYQDLTAEMDAAICTCTFELDGTKNVKGCVRCFKWRSRNRLAIEVHEDFLPDIESRQAQRFAILLELGLPEFLAWYREATWKLVLLGHKTTSTPEASSSVQHQENEPFLKIRESERLEPLGTWVSHAHSLTLASRKKSILQTHYRTRSLPATPDEVILPFAPAFSYYDADHHVWTKDVESRAPNFQHLLGLWLPPSALFNDPYAGDVKRRVREEVYSPSSYVIAANETQCPSNLSVQEFSAFQRAASGRGRRWMVLLVELGATNINFSSEAAMRLLSYLAIQAGPSVREQDVLREAHLPFRDRNFCQQLYEQLRARLETIAMSWREVHYMSILITFSLRLHHLRPRDLRWMVEDLLCRAREILSGWITRLRKDLRSSQDSQEAQKVAMHAFSAALLCRRSFFGLIDSAMLEKDQIYPGYGQKNDLLCFLRASIAVQENLVVDIEKLTPIQKTLLQQDLHDSYRLRGIIKNWLLRYGMDYLQEAINETWSEGEGSFKRSYSPWTFLTDQQDGWWIASHVTNPTVSAHPQVVHFHILQGQLLVDGQPLGRLPLSMRNDSVIKELFQDQYLLTRPSCIQGMQYQLATDVNNHQIHFGNRGGQVVVKAVFQGQLLEHVRRDIFRPADLPSTLIDGCVHWLNFDTGELEMRRKPEIWKSKRSRWILDINTHVVSRHREKASGGSQLLDSNSAFGQSVTRILSGFEDADKIIMYRARSRLYVELKRLELSFVVNKQGLLQSDQLQCEIDPDQDIGTLHGLGSGIVVRSLRNRRNRRVMVPLGDLKWMKRGMHIEVRISNEGEYSTFMVDQVLGRLSCPPEPLLLYLKAALHALTSFAIPDQLTGRTGTEEALSYLSSAASQPWTELSNGARKFLTTLQQGLMPTRAYYPAEMKLYQKLSSDMKLPTFIQHEALGAIADDILRQSQTLREFSQGRNRGDDYETSEEKETPYLNQLRLRGVIRRHLYERPCSAVDDLIPKDALEPRYFDTQSISRGTSKTSGRVYSVIKNLHEDDKPHSRFNLMPLRRLLEGQRLIGGFDQVLNSKPLHIADILDVNMRYSWGTLVEVCRKGNPFADYNVCFMLGLLAYGKQADKSLTLISWLMTIATNPQLREVITPIQNEPFRDYEGSTLPSHDTITTLILQSQTDHRRETNCQGAANQRQPRATATRSSPHQLESEASRLTPTLRNRLSINSSVTLEDFRSLASQAGCTHLKLSPVWKTLQPELQKISQNAKLHWYISQVDELAFAEEQRRKCLGARPCDLNSMPGKLTRPPRTSENVKTKHYCLPNLFDGISSKECKHASLSEWPSADSRDDVNGIKEEALPTSAGSQPVRDIVLTNSREIAILGKIIQEFATSLDATRQQYGKDLQQSLAALAEEESQLDLNVVLEQYQPKEYEELVEQIDETLGATKKQAASIQTSLSETEPGYLWLEQGSLWPSMSPVSLLQLLRRDIYLLLHPTMKGALILYGLLFTKLQRLLRMEDAFLSDEMGKMAVEEAHQGHTNWEPRDHPEWLLLEIDNDMLIRRNQVDVARAIIDPPTGANSVLQMNMGQGKTSCIMPMAIAELADKTRLCRVIVPRALLQQTAEVIQSRLGGLIGRVVRHVPFSRRTPTTQDILGQYREIHNQSLQSGGVVLCLPEHLLSFKLSGVQRLADGQLGPAGTMIEIHDWLEKSSRDILDESDFTLSAKTQLIYPSGSQVTVDGHPQRWLVTQEILSLLEGHVASLESHFPDGIHVLRRHKGFPILHFLRPEVEDALGELLIDDICQGRMVHLEFKSSVLTTEAQQDIRAVLDPQEEPPSSAWTKASDHLADSAFGFNNLLLLRGLVSRRIVLLCLKKRWNVQYGIHPTRPPIAVPFEAKGIPSETAEYGHPDTAIVLTCLAFYQTGLSKAHIVKSIRHIASLAEPASSFEALVQECYTLPTALRHWNLVNADDVQQMYELWEHLRFSRHVINQYMNSFVFPAHAKQFDLKIQASGWDIPLFVKDKEENKKKSTTKKKMADKKAADSRVSSSSGPQRSLTTGFSGTNDNKRMLPETISQNDLPSLLQTSAQVLKYLVEDRNRECLVAVDNTDRNLSEYGLLRLLCDKGIRVLIDSGAYILEMKNETVAQAWLEIDHAATGVVYFGENNKIMVRARFFKNPMPLLASPFANDLTKCLVYIDEAHTRGTDLKLPVRAKGALTLGLGQTKDHTVQGAMRLRQLGSTQSVVFVAPPEVYRSILDVRPAGSRTSASQNSIGSSINSIDVIRWVLEQSCKANQQMMSLHVAQGLDFCRRTEARWKQTKALTERVPRIQLLNIIRQKEEQTLVQLYGPKPVVNDIAHSTKSPAPLKSAKLESIVSLLNNKILALHHGRGNSDSLAFEEVEQEREVEFEVEQVRKKETPELLQALSFPGLSKSLVQFVKRGSLEFSDEFVHAFVYLGGTTIGQKYGVKRSSSKLYVSRQFCKTIVSRDTNTKKGITRPVEWILWSSPAQTAIIIIPEEAELLLPTLRSQQEPKVWLLSYSSPITKSMQPFNSLDYFTVPSPTLDFQLPGWISIEVGIIAGRLYFGWREYSALLAWVGTPIEQQGLEEEGDVESACGLSSSFTRKFLLDWLTHRHPSHNVLQTPMGFVCQGRELRPDHSFFASLPGRTAVTNPEVHSCPSPKNIDTGDDSMSDED